MAMASSSFFILLQEPCLLFNQIQGDVVSLINHAYEITTEYVATNLGWDIILKAFLLGLLFCCVLIWRRRVMRLDNATFTITLENKYETTKQIPENELCILFDLVKSAHKPDVLEKAISFIDKYNVDPNTVKPNSDSGLTLFLSACFSTKRSLLKYMIDRGANTEVKTKWKDMAIHLVTFALSSCSKHDYGSLSVLLDAGCNINSQNWRGNTPLSIAAASGKIGLIQYLLRNGADPYIGNSDGVFPIDFAINAGYKKAGELLIVNVRNAHVWDVVDPHTPPRIKLGLQSPSKFHLVESTFTKRRPVGMTC